MKYTLKWLYFQVWFYFVSDINLHNTAIFYQKYKNIQISFYDFKMN